MLDGEDSDGVSGETVVVGEEEAGRDDSGSGGEGSGSTRTADWTWATIGNVDIGNRGVRMIGSKDRGGSRHMG